MKIEILFLGSKMIVFYYKKDDGFLKYLISSTARELLGLENTGTVHIR